MSKKSKETIVDTPFYQYLWSFYADHKKEIWREYKLLTRGILSRADYTDASAFLRKPQYEAFERGRFKLCLDLKRESRHRG